MYNSQLDYINRMEAEGDTLVIAPEKPLPIGRIESDPEKLKNVYNMGRKAATERLEKIKEFLLG